MSQTLSPVAEKDVATLTGKLRGRVLQQSDPGYPDACKLWNGTIVRRPRLIVRPTGAADVIAAIAFAREHGLPVSVRGGGHNVAGNALGDDGLAIDLSEMRGVRVDPEHRVARVEGGATLGDVDHETQAQGLATPLGVVSRTGVAGLTLHGGLGFLARHHGLSCDNLIGADVVTADGRLVTATRQRNTDLLWALRGGGGNFGVVTSLEYQLHPVGPDVWVFLVMYPIDLAAPVFKFFREYMPDAPDDLMTIAILWNSPHDSSIPEAARNQPVVILAGVHSGPFADGERAVAPFRQVATPLVDFSGPMAFVNAQRLFDADYPDGRRYYWKSLYLDSLDDAAVTTLVAQAARRPSKSAQSTSGRSVGRSAASPRGAAHFRIATGRICLGSRSIEMARSTMPRISPGRAVCSPTWAASRGAVST